VRHEPAPSVAVTARLRGILAGFSLSVLGDAVTRTTLIWYVFHLTGSSVSLGWLSFCFTAPVIVGGMTAGWLLDRYDRRTVMAIDSLAKLPLVISIPVLAAIDAMPLWYVFAVAGVFGFLMMFPLAGVPSLLPALVGRDELNAANALETTGYTAGGVLGPPLAGALLVAVPVFADGVLGGGPELYGLLLGCIALGELASSMTIGFVRLPIPEGLAICVAALLSGGAVAVLAFGPNAAAAAVGLALYGAFSAPLTIWGQTLRMKIIPSGFHGRCFAIMRTLMQSGGPLGGVSAGFAMPLLGIRAAIAAVALITCLVGGLGLSVAELRRAR